MESQPANGVEPPTVAELAAYIGARVEGRGLPVVTDVAALHTPLAAPRCALTWWNGRAEVPPGWARGVVIAARPVADTLATLVIDNPKLGLARALAHRYFRGYTPPAWRAGAPRTGRPGQSFVWDPEQGVYLALRHLYGVRIGVRCGVEPSATIQRGLLHDTVIGDYVNIGFGVNVGHGARIGDHCIVTAHACLGGSVRLGPRVFVGMNATIKNGVTVGANATVGAGAVVIRDVPEGATVVGNPARILP